MNDNYIIRRAESKDDAGRLNIHNDSGPGKIASAFGAEKGKTENLCRRYPEKENVITDSVSTKIIFRRSASDTEPGRISDISRRMFFRDLSRGVCLWKFCFSGQNHGSMSNIEEK